MFYHASFPQGRLYFSGEFNTSLRSRDSIVEYSSACSRIFSSFHWSQSLHSRRRSPFSYGFRRASKKRGCPMRSPSSVTYLLSFSRNESKRCASSFFSRSKQRSRFSQSTVYMIAYDFESCHYHSRGTKSGMVRAFSSLLYHDALR